MRTNDRARKHGRAGKSRFRCLKETKSIVKKKKKLATTFHLAPQRSLPVCLCVSGPVFSPADLSLVPARSLRKTTHNSQPNPAAAQESLAERVAETSTTAAAAAAPAPSLSWPWLFRRNSTLPPQQLPTPPAFCALVYAPVCGANNVTYPNKCVAESRRVSVAHAGACAGQEGNLRRPYSFGRPGGRRAPPAPAPSPSSALFAAAFSSASAPAPASRLSASSSSASSLAAARRAQPLNSELAAAAREAEEREAEEEEGSGGAAAFVAPSAAASAADAEEVEAEAEAAEDELKAEFEAEEAVTERETDEEGDSAEEASSSPEGADDIILALPSPSRPAAACPRNYMPVCATVPSTGTAKTFDNDCLARAEGATVTRPGACSGPPGGKNPVGVIVPAAAAAAAPAAASEIQQPLATPATKAGSSSSSSSSSFSSFAAQRSPPSTRYRLPAIESPEEQERLDVGSGGVEV